MHPRPMECLNSIHSYYKKGNDEYATYYIRHGSLMNLLIIAGAVARESKVPFQSPSVMNKLKLLTMQR